MTKFFKEISKCVQGDAECRGKHSSGLATDECQYCSETKCTCAYEAENAGLTMTEYRLINLRHWSDEDFEFSAGIMRDSEFYEPQAPDAVVSSVGQLLDKLQVSAPFKLPENALDHMEGIAVLALGLLHAKDVYSASAAILGYARGIVKGSIIQALADYITELRKSSDWGNQALEVDDWLALLRGARNNWKLVVDNVHWDNLRNVISILVSLNMCDASCVDFSICGVKLFSERVKKNQASAVDLIGAIVETITMFVEGGFECFRTGSLKPMLYGDAEMYRLREDCERLEYLFSFAKSGDLARAEPKCTVAEYTKLMTDCIDKLKTFQLTAKGTAVKQMINIKLAALLQQKNIYERTCNKSGLREAPWSVLLYGDSGVGKSTVATILMNVSLMQNGFPAADSHQIYNDPRDKYDSTLKSYATGIYFDDMCNQKAEFEKESPIDEHLRVNNNTRCYGNMAEADEKGKVLKEPKVSIMTTNVKNLCSTTYSNNALSIERRNKTIVTVSVKKQFADANGMLDDQKVEDYYVGTLGLEKVPVIIDVWWFTIEKAHGKSLGNGKVDQNDVVYIPCTLNGKRLVHVGMADLLAYNYENSKIHFRTQKRVVENNTNVSEKISICECGQPIQPGLSFCTCGREEEVQFGKLGQMVGDMMHQKVMSKMGIVRKRVNGICHIVEYATMREMQKRLNWLEHSPYVKWTNWIPYSYLGNPYIKEAILAMHYDEIEDAIGTAYLSMTIAFVAFLFATYFFKILLLVSPFVIFYYLYWMMGVVEAEKDRLYQKIMHENKSLDPIFEQFRNDCITYMTVGSVVLGAIYSLACVWKTMAQIEMLPQGNLQPKTMEEIKERNEEAAVEEQIAREQGWDQFSFAPIPCSEKSLTITSEQLVKKVYANSVQFTAKVNGEDSGCDMVFIDGNFAVVPKHIWVKDTLYATVHRGVKSKQTFNAWLSKSHSVDIEGTDLSVVYVPNAGSWASLVDYLPEVHYEAGRALPSIFTYKDMRGDVPEHLTCKTVANTQLVKMRENEYHGAKYELSFNTFVGLCMGSTISDTRETLIVGFHTAGISGTKKGACCTLLKSDYIFARDQLLKIKTVCGGASEGDMQSELYGKKVFTGPQIHEKSPVHDIPTNSNVEVYGSCVGQATYYSTVIDTPIKDDVKEIFGEITDYGPPAFYLGDAFNKSLQVSSKPSCGMPPDLLTMAGEDYHNDLIEQFGIFPELLREMRPLTLIENVNGIPGMRFVDAMAPNTSVGLPEGGAKRHRMSPIENLHEHLTSFGITDEEYVQLFANHADHMMQLDQKYIDEMERMEKEYLAGRRCYPVFKACLKDEPTKKGKLKVRVFQAAPIAFQLLIRKYFLMITRTMSIFPITSECGVGVNTMGPEYSQLIEYIKKFGDDRILAGDYSKYDLRMPAQLIFAALDILIEIAKESPYYSEDDIKIMRGIATDIAYPVMAYNGSLVQHIGSNPSGQNLTVYVNSIVNSLLLRCAFKKLYPEVRFKEAVAMMTYGDDAKGSVKEGFDKFNHIYFAEFLKDLDIVFTMPDKESTPVPFMHHKEADFLKRMDIWNPRLRLWQGALCEESIIKSLISVKKSKSISPYEQVMGNIDGALREWWFHGEEVYEDRRAKLTTIASKHSIHTGCKMLLKSYETYEQEYCKRYGLKLP